MPRNHSWTPEGEQQAAEAYREDVRKICEKKKLNLNTVISQLKAELGAKETRATYDKNILDWAYSNPLVAHMPRLKAIDIALKLLDAYPAEKKQLSGPGGGPIPVKYDDIDPTRRAELDAVLDSLYGKGAKTEPKKTVKKRKPKKKVNAKIKPRRK